jgi:hypothetical protein
LNLQKSQNNVALFTKYQLDDHKEELRRDTGCSMYGGAEKYIQPVVRNTKGKRQFERSSHRWEIILKCIFRKQDMRV